VKAAARAASGCLLLWAASARASDVGLELAGCPGLSQAALREHLELELATLGLARSELRLRVRCEGSVALIELRPEAGPRYPVEVRVELRATARGARERLVALAATELLAQAERNREASHESAPPAAAHALSPSRPARDEPNVETRPGRRRSSELFVAGSAALDGAPKTLLWGGTLGALLGLGHGYSIALDTRFERGQKQLPLAAVKWSVLSGFAGPMLRAEPGPLVVGAGFGVRAGWLALAAEASAPHEGRSLTAPWAGLALPLRLALPLGRGVAPFVAVEPGYVVVPVRGVAADVGGGSESVLMAQRGVWVSGSFGVGIAL
jgi:hypothetical protein